MDLPLDIRTRDAELVLDTTDDVSSTRLLAYAYQAGARVRLELGVADVQALAGALLQWLAANGHDAPELTEAELAHYSDEDEDEDGRPPLSDPPPLADFGGLEVYRTIGSDAVRIDRADPWVLADGQLLEQLLMPATPWADVDGLNLTIRDSSGTVVRYLVRPDVPTAGGAVALQKVGGHGPLPVPVPDMSALPGR
jgi:hypothetical protein